MLRVGIYRPVGVPRADYALTHAFTGVNYIPTAGITLLVYYKGCGRLRITDEQKPDTPLFFVVELKLTPSDLGILRATN